MPTQNRAHVLRVPRGSSELESAIEATGSGEVAKAVLVH